VVQDGVQALIRLVFWQGATIKTDDETGKIVIARIMHGGAADRSGLIHVGDEVCEVNGINVEGKTPSDVLKILVSLLKPPPPSRLSWKCAELDLCVAAKFGGHDHVQACSGRREAWSAGEPRPGAGALRLRRLDGSLHPLQGSRPGLRQRRYSSYCQSG